LCRYVRAANVKKTPLTPITVTLNEAVRITGVSRSRFYKWIEAGLLSVRYNGSRPLLMFAELEAVIDGLPRGPRFTGPLLPPEDRALAKERAGEPDFAGVFADHLQRPSLGEAEARTRALAATIRAYRKYHECDFKTARAAVLALIERASEPEPPPTDLQQSDIGLGPPEPDFRRLYFERLNPDAGEEGKPRGFEFVANAYGRFHNCSLEDAERAVMALLKA
jgi:uncharacterized protein (DUF2267 family)